LVRFWHKRDWTRHQKAKKEISYPNRTAAKRGNTRAAECENVMMLYVEDMKGNPIDGNRASEIRKVSRALFIQFAHAGVAPKTWTKAAMSSADFYQREMGKQFLELRLYVSSWKFDQIATDSYPSWHSHYFKELTVKQEGGDATVAK
jgi:hypothetical protein